MAPDHQTSDRVYAALKSDLLMGDLGSGRINITALESRYSASATPVREALLRLVGERLVDMRPSGGFASWQVSEREARDLYEFNGRLLLLAIGWAREPLQTIGWPHAGDDVEARIGSLFVAIAELSHNMMLTMTVEATNDRLHTLRRAERSVLPGLDREFAHLCAALGDGRKETLRRSVAAYHQRRLRNLVPILRGVAR